MDKQKLAKLITDGRFEAVVIPSTADRQERARLVREFTRKVETGRDGEMILVLVRP